MSYKTILVHAGSGAGADARIRLAARLARTSDAHLIGCAPTGISRFMPPQAFGAGSVVAARCAALRHEAAAALAHFEGLAGEEAVASCEARLVEDDTAAALALAARYCDLAVLGGPDPGAAGPRQPQGLAAELLLTGGRPVLVVPADAVPSALEGDALVAWDGGSGATRAAAAALPLLRAARRTVVLGTDAQACAELAAWLGRHGIAARSAPIAPRNDVGTALLASARQEGAGLLVMGAYGHARLREAVLGGATETVLRAAALPVLLAH
ncbi:MAG: universal stress protein [Ramlibacter sp.]